MDHDCAGRDLKPAALVAPHGEGCRLLVRLTPKSARDAIEGVEMLADGRLYLKGRVRAVPEKGKANAALMRLLAKTLGLPASAVTVVSGSTSRLKTVHVEAAPSEIAARLADLS